jgi:hypothetical protein
MNTGAGMSKAKKAATPTNARPLDVQLRPGESKQEALVRTYIQPTLNAGYTMRTAMKRDFGELDLADVAGELQDQCAAVQRGDLARPEAVLTAQAHMLDAVSNGLMRLAYRNMDNFDVAERLFRLAFKAQSQGRATIETLATIKNPPMVFARQANVTSGPQQINNGVPLAREIQTEQNKLLEQTNGERLDTGAAGEAIESGAAMATVGTSDRTKDT